MPPALNERFIQNEIELQIEDEFTESAQVTSITDESNKQMNTLVIIKKKRVKFEWMNEFYEDAGAMSPRFTKQG